LFLAGGAAVALWKLVVLLLAASSASADEGPGLIKVLLALVGLTFVVSGLLVLKERPSRPRLLFAGFCLCAGLHWGGPLEPAPGPLRTSLLFFYLLVSSLVGEALFLHFALLFPKRTNAGDSRLVRYFLYGPLVAGTLLAILAVIGSKGSGTQAAGQTGFLMLHTVISNLFPALVLLLYVSYVARRKVTPIERPHVALMVAGMLIAWLPYLAASVAGWEPDPWNLSMVALPVAFAIGILGIERTRTSAEVHG